MNRSDRVKVIKNIYNHIVKASSARMLEYDYIEPRASSEFSGYAFRYYEDSDQLKVIDSPGCVDKGLIFEPGSSEHSHLTAIKHLWERYPFEGGTCTPEARDPKPIGGASENVAVQSEESQAVSPGQFLGSPGQFLGSSGQEGSAQEARVSQSVSHPDVDFSEIQTVRPSGGQLAEFSGGNWRYHQPNLGELKWFIENGVTDFIRLSGDGSGDLIDDPQSGISITVDVQKRFVEGLGANFHRPSAHSGYRFGQGYTRSIQTCNSLLSGGNCLVHCRWGADRTGYIVAAFLKETGSMTDLEELWNYTIGFNRWESKICSDASNLGYSKYLDGFYPLNEFCEAHSDCDVCNKLDQLR